MSKRLFHIVITGMIVMTISLSACKKLIEIDTPLNETPSAAIFASDNTSLSALSGMYGFFQQALVQNTELSVNYSLMADDLRYLGLVTSTLEYANNTYMANTASTEAFNSWYGIIYRANAIIQGLQQSSGASERIKRQLTAEARLMRAYCYFNLVNFYGDVPLVLSTDANITAFQPRETTANVYRQMISDLTDAKANLLPDYSFTSGDRIGVNSFTASALLARVYLFTGNYPEAERNASEVISSNLFSLTPSSRIGTALFVHNSAESIWQLPPYTNAANQFTAEASAFIPFNAFSAVNYALQPNLLQLFPANDLRRSAWMINRVQSGVTYTTPFKYKYRDNDVAAAAGVTENQIILRLAEQYLIRAEARANLGNIAGALSDLNVIRVRAGIAPSTTTGSATLITEIITEGRKEFFCEQGLRWYNLKRAGQADAVLGAMKPSYRPQAKLYPFAQSIINVNSNLIQNPGY